MSQQPESRNGEGNHPEAAAFHEWWKKQGLAGEEHSVKRWSAWNGWLARSALPSEIEYTHAARWHFGVEHGWPSFHKQIHPTEKMLGWRMPSQNPPDGVSFDPADYQYYESAEAAIDAAMKANRQVEAE